MTTATKVAIKPLEDRIVVQALEAETTTASGLVIPDTAKEKPQEGEVLAVGPGRLDDNGKRIPVDVSTGDYEDLVKAGVIDAAKVTRSALQNAASIAALFLTTEAVIVDRPERNSAGDTSGGIGGMDF